MAQATTPYDAKALFAKLDKTFLLLAGACDEQFIPEKVIAFHHHAVQVKDRSISQIIPGATHLSLVIEAPAIIAQACADWKIFSSALGSYKLVGKAMKKC